MPARTSTVPTLIEKVNLRDCTDVARVSALLRKLRYPVDAEPVPVPLDVEELALRLREEVAARYPLARIDGSHPGDLLDVVLFVLAPDAQRAPLVRGISQAWMRRFPGYHLLIFAQAGANGFDQLTFVHPRRVGEGAEVRVKLHKLIVERTAPTRHDVETLNRIAVPAGGTTPEALNTLLTEAFNVERITNAFYREYAQRFHSAMDQIEEWNRHIIPAFMDPDPQVRKARLHAFTQRLFGRLMFLYFLQKKGALNRDQNFISTQYQRAASENENFYQHVLEPLFFSTLNQHRPDSRSDFGQIPYLNGGLFAPDADDHQGQVYLDNALFDANSTSGLLYFLKNHNFTVEEDTPLEVQVALDPEMLGKVFENLLESEERGKAGAFYTPRAVVAFMCREAMASYLERIPGLAPDTLRLLLDEAETGVPVRDEHNQERLTSANISWQVSERIEDALKNLRVLDPAVGSGAFPLGMLSLLVGLRRALYRIGGAQVEPQSRVVEGWKRQFIRDCLYGVDKNHEAVEIARLRLWLSLVVDADPFNMLPLPNLDYKLMEGNSLIETFQGVAIYPTRPGDGPTQQTLLGDEASRELIEKLHRLKDAFFQPEGTEERARLREEIHGAEVELVEEYLKERIKNLDVKHEGIERKLANIRGNEPSDLKAERLQVEHARFATKAALDDLKQGKHLPFFLYRLHFPEVFERKGGFDIVIANPPYVRHEKVSPDTLATLKAAYPSVAHGMADLYAYFYARALQLLHDGGALCFISSNKFYRAGYGKGLRETLARETSTRLVIDFGDFPVFDAAAYPCILIAEKGTPAPSHTYRGLTAGPAIELDKLDETLTREGQSLAQADGVRPPTGNAASSALVAKLLGMGTPLGQYVGGKMYYGIKTGLNEAFV